MSSRLSHRRRLGAVLLVGAMLACQQTAAAQPSAPGGASAGVAPPQVFSVLTQSTASGAYDSSIRFLPDSSISLVAFTGRLLWHTSLPSIAPLKLAAVGDFTGDGVPDYVFVETRLATGGGTCGDTPRDATVPGFVDGRTGAVSYPAPALEDKCWSFSTEYPTHQWGTGTVYIGDPASAALNREVFLIPYYADRGWALTWSFDQGWKRVAGADGRPDLVFPSTEAFDRYYNAVNTTPCQFSPGTRHCYVDNSHVANAVFVGGSGARSLFLLTSFRALLYSPDLAPSADLVWLAGGTVDHAGRNYGLLTAFGAVPNGTAVTLIGGCSVVNARNAMRAGHLTATTCGIHRHYEYFRVAAGRIVDHVSRYFSYSDADGPFQKRIEYPAALAAAGRPTVYNLYESGAWRTVMLADPSQPDLSTILRDWFTWDVLRVGNQVWLLATRTQEDPKGGGGGYLPPWSYDVLAVHGSAVTSLVHHDGVIPTLLGYGQQSSVHAADGQIMATLVLPSTTGGRQLLVEDAQGSRSWEPLPILPLGSGPG